MKNFKFTLKMVRILVGVFVTISLYVTFTQPAFQDSVSVNLLLWKSPEVPVYVFIIIAFVVALFIGLFMAGVDHWSMARQMREVVNENSELTQRLSSLEELVSKLKEGEEENSLEDLGLQEDHSLMTEKPSLDS